MRFAREGLILILPLVLIASALLIWGMLRDKSAFVASGITIGFIAGAILLFFRDPDRKIPEGENLIVSPADGKVIITQTLPDGRKHIAIFLSVFDVHINRNPASGIVSNVINKPGTYLHAGSDGAAQGNARVEVIANTAYGEIAWRQVSGLIARKIACWLKNGDSIRRGERFGLIYFGSRMEVFLPSTAEITAKVGQMVAGGESVIAQFPMKG